MKNEDKPIKETEVPKMATITYSDGHTEDVDAEKLQQLLTLANKIESAKKTNDSEIEELEILRNILSILLDFDMFVPGTVPQNKEQEEQARELYKSTLQKINNYLDSYEPGEIPQDGGIVAFLRGELDYMMAPRPRGYNELLKINSTGEKGLQYRELENEVKISFSNRLAYEEQKIRQAAELEFIKNNFHGATKNLNTRVAIPINDVMHMLGRPNNPNNKKQFRRKIDNDILEDIRSEYIEVKIRDGKDGANDIWIRTNIVQSCGRVRDYIYFQFSEDYARYINTGVIKPYHKNTIHLGSRQFPLPFYVCTVMQNQYFGYSNQNRTRKDSDRKGTHDILKIKTLLNFCKEVLDFEYIIENDPTHWKRKIKDRYERALNEITEKGIFKWEYCKKSLGEITQAEIESADFYQWSELYITFQLIPEEPADQAQRIENRARRIEAAKAKKALEDDKASAEAEKVRKRRRRKSTPKTKKG